MTVRVAVVSVFVTFTSTPGNTAPEESRTVPDIWEATVCPNTKGHRTKIVAHIANTLFIETPTVFGCEKTFNSAIGKRPENRKLAVRPQ
jgi:hypothetical protein